MPGCTTRLSYPLLCILHTMPSGRSGCRSIARQRRRRPNRLPLRARWCLTHEQEVTPLMSGIANIGVFRCLRGIEDDWPSDQVEELLTVQHIGIFLEGLQKRFGEHRMFLATATV